MAEAKPAGDRPWRLETRDDIDGGTYQAWTNEPTGAVERAAEAIVREEGVIDWDVLSEPLREHPRGQALAALAAALDGPELEDLIVEMLASAGDRSWALSDGPKLARRIRATILGTDS